MADWNIPLYAGPLTRGVQVQPPTVPTLCRPEGCVLWLAPPAAGPRVSRWTDRSGLQNHATQAVVSRRPTATADGILI